MISSSLMIKSLFAKACFDMNFARLFQVVLARWKSVSVVFIICAILGVVIAYFVPKSYTSQATVVVDAKTDPVAGVAQIMTPNYLMTQVDIIKSTRVSNLVIRQIKLDQNQALRDQYTSSKIQTTFDEWLSSLLQKALVAEAGRGSNVIKISYTSTDSKFSALMANAFVRAYLDTILEMRIEPARQYAEFFDDRSKKLREAVEKAQSKLSAYQKEKGLIGSDERSDIENSRLAELSQQLLQAQAAAIEASSRQKQAQLASDRSQEVLTNGLINGFKTDLAKQETRYQELISKYGDAHPQVVEAQVTIRDIKSKIEFETKRISGASVVTTSISRQKEAEIKAALEGQRSKVLKLKEVRDDLTVLQRDLENSQKVYDNVQQRLNQSTLESQNQQSNVSVLSQAEVSTESSSQIFLKNAVKALAASFGIAFLAAFLLEFLDKRVRVLEDVSEFIDLPVIGIMPKPDKSSFFGRVKQTPLQRRLLRQLPGPTA
jgi:polysaccharide biosynthesis transport protein